MILEPGPVIKFLLANQSVESPRQIDWIKVVLAFKCKNSEHAWLLLFWAFEFLIETWQAAKMLKHMRVKASHRNMEFKIIGLSQKPCNQQLYVPHDCTFHINFCPLYQPLLDFLHCFPGFQWRLKMVNVKERLEILLCMNISSKLTQSLLLLRTCHALMLASQIAPTIFHWRYASPAVYIPFLEVCIFEFLILFVQFCNLVSLQRYTKALSGRQRASLVVKSRQKPLERIKTLNDVSFVFWLGWCVIYLGWQILLLTRIVGNA